MKTVLLLTAFSLLYSAAFAQSIQQGIWHLNGTIIIRPNDTTQIEIQNGEFDTLSVEWLGEKRYRLIKSGTPTLTVFVTKIFKTGSYLGTITDGKKENFKSIKSK
jgi:hypothetical protein